MLSALLNIFNNKKKVDVPEISIETSSSEPVIQTAEDIQELAGIDFPEYLLEDPRIAGWSSSIEQRMLFEKLLTYYRSHQRILDVGCSRGDLYGYLQEKQWPADKTDYQGIDIDQNKISIGNVKFPEANLLCKDILEMQGSFSWVIASGLFNSSDYYSNDVDASIAYQKLIVQKMYDLSQKGIAFNLLTELPESLTGEERDRFIVHSPGDWLEYLINSYNYVICSADYLRGDVTFFIFK
jgi:SAM-dependent methyltransferase